MEKEFPKFRNKQEWIDYYIKVYEQQNNSKPDIDNLSKIVDLAERSTDERINKLQTQPWLERNFVMLLTIVIVVAIFVFISVGGAKAADNLRYIPEPMWNIFTIVISFWFGGNVGSHLIDKWKNS